MNCHRRRAPTETMNYGTCFRFNDESATGRCDDNLRGVAGEDQRAGTWVNPQIAHYFLVPVGCKSSPKRQHGEPWGRTRSDASSHPTPRLGNQLPNTTPAVPACHGATDDEPLRIDAIRKALTARAPRDLRHHAQRRSFRMRDRKAGLRRPRPDGSPRRHRSRKAGNHSKLRMPDAGAPPTLGFGVRG